MKIGVSSYSFQQLINSGAETHLSIMKKAKEMGFDGIEFTDLSAPEGVSEKEFAMIIKEESEKLSLPVIAYTISANLLCEEGLDAEVERVCRKIDIAEILGAGCLRHDAAWNVPDEAQCVRLWDKYGMMPHIREHCRAVSSVRISYFIRNNIIACCIYRWRCHTKRYLKHIIPSK